MNYRVLWTPSAERDLAGVWVKAPDRAAVTHASSELDARLADEGDEAGESRYPPVRIVIEPPLAAEFEVDVSERIVFVRAVWAFRTQ